MPPPTVRDIGNASVKATFVKAPLGGKAVRKTRSTPFYNRRSLFSLSVLSDTVQHGVLPILRTAFPHRPALTNVAFTLAFPISLTVSGGITQDLVLRAWDTVVVFVVHIRISGQVSFPGHWPLVGERWDSSTVKDLFQIHGFL